MYSYPHAISCWTFQTGQRINNGLVFDKITRSKLLYKRIGTQSKNEEYINNDAVIIVHAYMSSANIDLFCDYGLFV